MTGRGKVFFRYPIVAHDETELRSKAQSKMPISTFLAGFVFTALIEVVLTRQLSTARSVATVALTLALALLLACVYIYDELSVPEGFWTDGRRSGVALRIANWRQRRRDDRWGKIAGQYGARAADYHQKALVLDGPLFLTMVSTSRLVFTPAVCLAIVGFVARWS